MGWAENAIALPAIRIQARFETESVQWLPLILLKVGILGVRGLTGQGGHENPERDITPCQLDGIRDKPGRAVVTVTDLDLGLPFDSTQVD